MARMMDSLRIWSAPYGGETFLLLALLALASYGLLLLYKARLSDSQLRRCIRLAALIALPLSFVAMEMGRDNWAIAGLSFIWCIVLGVTCKNEITNRHTP
jgi:cytochrome bd-type quinol oxidase subunit 1